MLRLFFSALGLLLTITAARAADVVEPNQELLAQTVARAEQLTRIHALIVAYDGKTIVERVFRGPGLDRPVNIKSASKAIIDALVGIAIDRGMIKSVDQPMLPLLKKRAPELMDPKVATITVDHLLSMRAGLDRTSGLQNYGPWVQSQNWVQFALSRSFIDEPGGEMLYSTGNTHLLSAILTDVTGKDTWQLAREWLGAPLNIAIPQWTRDPQGVYFGGNEMALSPRALIAFGEMYRNGGMHDGKRVVPSNWIKASWTPWTDDMRGRAYGYGWFIGEALAQPVYYAWGFGGQLLYVIPSMKLTIAVTSDVSTRSAVDSYLCRVHDLVAFGFIPAVMKNPPPIPPDLAVC